MSNRANKGLTVAKLKVGELYLDQLSGLRVLVLEDMVTGPHEGEPCKVTLKHLRYGWSYNPVYGAHQRVDLKDGQLVPLPLSISER